MTDKLKARLEDIERRIEENSETLRERAPETDSAILASAAKYLDVLKRLAKE